MRIAIDVSQMCYLGSGVSRYVTGLTKALLESSSHEFVLYAGTLRQRSFFTRLSQEKPWNQATWKIFPLPPRLAGFALTDSEIPFELLTGPVDLIHASDWSQPSAKAPIVTTVHDLVFVKYPSTVEPSILRAQTKRLNKIVASQTQIIADSMSTKNDLMEIYHLPSSRIDVVYPGIDNRYAPQKTKEIDRVKRLYDLPDQYILSVGTQEPRKNLARLVEAVSSLDIPLVIVGKHGWGSQTKTLGYVPDSDLPAIYASASVFAYPSLYEGFGFPVLEAMACQTPVVTSNISSLPELVGKAGILIDPTDVTSISTGIKQALASRSKLIELGLKQSQKFTWDNTAKQTLEVYEKIIHRD